MLICPTSSCWTLAPPPPPAGTFWTSRQQMRTHLNYNLSRVNVQGSGVITARIGGELLGDPL